MERILPLNYLLLLVLRLTVTASSTLPFLFLDLKWIFCLSPSFSSSSVSWCFSGPKSSGCACLPFLSVVSKFCQSSRNATALFFSLHPVVMYRRAVLPSSSCFLNSQLRWCLSSFFCCRITLHPSLSIFIGAYFEAVPMFEFLRNVQCIHFKIYMCWLMT